MFHMRVSQSLNLQFGVFTVLLFHTVLIGQVHPCRGQHQVVGPPQPIVALVGEDIILPSVLDPPMNTFDMTVEWTRRDLDPRFVLVWRDGVELENKKHPSYVGRASVFTDELKRGNVSLKLSEVKISDGGTYRCFIPDFNIISTVQLVVGAVSSPVIQMTRNISPVVLHCESEGWYPEPVVSWLDSEGHVLSAGPTETVRGPDGLYNVSSRVTVEERHNNNFTCRVQQKNINQTRETQIHVPGHFFVVASTPSTSSTPSTPGTPGSLPAIFVCAAFFLTVVFLLWEICRQKRLRNKRRDLEYGAKQTDKEKTVGSESDDTRFQVMKEGEEESVPLMARREEDNNLDNTGQEEIQSQSEHKDPKSVAKEETNQDQPISILKEEQKHQRQGWLGRQAKSDLDKDEREHIIKPAKEDSGLSMVVVVEEQKEQLQNLHTYQEEQNEEETQQEQVTHQRKAKGRKKKVTQEQPKKLSKARQRKEQREQKLLEEERQRDDYERKLISELQKRNEKDEIKLKSQKGVDGHHPLEDKEREGSKAELKGKREEGQKGNHNDISGMTERKAENQKEEMTEKLKETGDRTVENRGGLQSERPEQIKIVKEMIEKGNSSQHVLDTSKQEVEVEDNKGGDREEKHCDIITMTERDMRMDENEKLEDTRQKKRDERENKLPLVSREVTERLDPSTHQETAGTHEQEFQEENKLQAEKQLEEKSLRNQGETKLELEQSTKGDEIDEAQKMSKETGRKPRDGEGQLQTVQQPGVKEEIRAQPEGSFIYPAETVAECHEEEAVEIYRRPAIGATQSNVNRRTKQQHKQENQLHVDQKQEVEKRKHQEEYEVQTGQEPMDYEEAGDTGQKVIDEIETMDYNTQVDQEHVSQDDQPEPMEF